MYPPAPAPKLLVTGFGPFPNAPENPTEPLVLGLASAAPEAFGASALRAIVLPTDYRKSWLALSRLYQAFAPDIVVHFGLARRAETLILERFGRKTIRADQPDAAGFAPRSGLARRFGPDALPVTLPIEAIRAALFRAGFHSEFSDDAGGYVCNATLYRSLLSLSGGSRMVGFVHVPPEGVGGFSPGRLREAANLVLTRSASLWAASQGPTPARR